VDVIAAGFFVIIGIVAMSVEKGWTALVCFALAIGFLMVKYWE